MLGLIPHLFEALCRLVLPLLLPMLRLARSGLPHGAASVAEARKRSREHKLNGCGVLAVVAIVMPVMLAQEMQKTILPPPKSVSTGLLIMVGSVAVHDDMGT